MFSRVFTLEPHNSTIFFLVLTLFFCIRKDKIHPKQLPEPLLIQSFAFALQIFFLVPSCFLVVASYLLRKDSPPKQVKIN